LKLEAQHPFSNEIQLKADEIEACFPVGGAVPEHV
jgi:hypothetical protein